MRFKNNPIANTNETKFHGDTIKTTVAILREEIGEPAVEVNEGTNDYNFMWVCELESGEVFTVYDWRVGRAIEEDETIEFNIGSKTTMLGIDAEYALQYL